mgnify:CR=1 FL=1
MKTIKVKIKSNYGKDLIYPVCEGAFIFARLTDTKTLTSYAIANIKALGYAIEVQTQTL